MSNARRRSTSTSGEPIPEPMTEREARAALFRFGMHATPEYEAEAARAWSTFAERSTATLLDGRPSLSDARAVATFSDDEALAAHAAAWCEWRESEPDPRPLLDEETAADTSRAIEAHRAAEPKPTRTTRRKATQ